MKSFALFTQFCQNQFGRKCFIAGNTIVINADAYDALYTLTDKFGQFAGCWINDPPYGTTLNSWDKIIPVDDYWDMVEAATTPTAPLIVFGSQPFTSAMVMSADRWHRYCLVWEKGKCGSPGLAKYRPMKTHEDIMVFSRQTHKYYPQMEVGEPYQRSIREKKRLNNHGYGFKADSEIANTGTRYPKSILHFPRNFSAQQQIHPTQKPTTLLNWLLRSYTQRDTIVLDITAGSSSLGAAAYSLRQPCVCIEKDPVFFKIGREWLTALHRKLSWDPAACRKKYLGA